MRQLFKVVDIDRRSLETDMGVFETSCITIGPVRELPLQTGGIVHLKEGTSSQVILPGHVKFTVGTLLELREYEPNAGTKKSD